MQNSVVSDIVDAGTASEYRNKVKLLTYLYVKKIYNFLLTMDRYETYMLELRAIEYRQSP